METMAHLELLAARGSITSLDDGGVNVYAPSRRPVVAASRTIWPKTGTQQSESE